MVYQRLSRISGVSLGLLLGAHILGTADCLVFGTTKTEQASALQGRRDFVQRTLMGSASILGSLCTTVDDANAAVLQSKPCALGEGDGCADIAEGNEFIKSLQEKSAAKKDVYVKEALDAYNMKNYPDFFQSIGKVMVKKSDGTFATFSEEEFGKFKAAGRIGLEYPRAMGGKVPDMTQKPILVLKD
mmetsp:Transcript_17887/g.27807  ORF Transcript_17887/g.27807 Transcript_17887/m.27807 type:complete len:187 (+) Transcript_17887:70-630(+)